MVKAASWQYPSSAPAPPRCAPGGSGQLGTPSHCLGCSSPPPPKPPIPPPLTVQAQDNLVVFIHTDAGITGVGESDANPWMLKAAIEAPSTHTMGMGLKDMLMGADPLDDAEALRLCGHGEPWSAWTWRAG